MVDRILKAIGVIGVAASCVPMIAVLPGAVSAGLGAVGISASEGPFEPVAEVLAPIARPLLVIGLALLLVSVLRRAIVPAAVIAIGGSLFYASMYIVPDATGNHSGMTGMAGMGSPSGVADSAARSAGAAGTTHALTFYFGLGFLAAGFLLSLIKSRRGECRQSSRSKNDLLTFLTFLLRNRPG